MNRMITGRRLGPGLLPREDPLLIAQRSTGSDETDHITHDLSTNHLYLP